jgi:hypothetical protein
MTKVTLAKTTSLVAEDVSSDGSTDATKLFEGVFPSSASVSVSHASRTFKGAAHAMRWISSATKVIPTSHSNNHEDNSATTSTIRSTRKRGTSIKPSRKRVVNAFSMMRRKADTGQGSHSGDSIHGNEREQLRGIRLFRAAGNAIIFLKVMKMDQEFRKRILGVQNQTVEKDAGFSWVVDAHVLQWWSAIQGLMSMMSMFTEPYIVAFVLDNRPGFDDQSEDETFSLTDPLVQLLLVFNLVFTFDIALTFVTPIKRNKKVVSTNVAIATQYLSSWFVIDLISVIGGWASFTTMNRFYRLCLVLRLLKTERVSAFTDRVLRLLVSRTQRNGIQSFGARWFNLFASGTVVAHLSACLFFLVAVYENHRYDSWTTLSGVRNLEPQQQYVTALYWAAATMVTTGG